MKTADIENDTRITRVIFTGETVSICITDKTRNITNCSIVSRFEWDQIVSAGE